MAKMIERNGTSDAIVVSSLMVFYRGVGRPEISKAPEGTGFSNSNFVQGFQSKKSITQGFLEGRQAVWVRWFQDQIDARYERTHGSGLEIIADVLQELLEDSQLRCSALSNAVVSNRDFDVEHLQIVPSEKDQLKRVVELLAAKMGLHCPELAASAAVLIMERTIAMTLATGELWEFETARLLFQCLQHALSAEFN